MYRAHRAGQSGSLIYQPVQEQAKQTTLYEGSQQYQGLGSYQNRPAPEDTRSELAKAYAAEHSPWERARRQAAEADEAEARAQAQQTALDVLQGRGLDQTHGLYSAADRAAHRDYAARTRADGVAFERNGHLAASAQQTLGQVSLDMLSRLPKRDQPVVAQRAQIPTGSSGTGWL